jgi:mRNA interferase YafQ
MLRLAPSGRFKRDVKRAATRGKNIGKLTTILDLLLARQPLPASYNDHPLRGNWKGWRDLHIEPDWLLIYRVAGDRLELAATASHSDLFDE